MQNHLQFRQTASFGKQPALANSQLWQTVQLPQTDAAAQRLNKRRQRMDSSLAQIGPRLRAERTAHGLTLDELATRAGMSISTLSRLESGKRQANLELLLPLARELRLGLDDLVPPSVPDPRVTQKPYRRHGIQFTPLSPTNAPVSTFRMVYPARVKAPEQRTHDGYEWCYIISGRLRLLLGDHDLTLEPGEAAEFDTRVPHSMHGLGPGTTEVLSIFNQDGAKIHTRARTTATATD